MVWPLPRPWSETMVSIPLRAQRTREIKGFLGLERPFLDLVSQTQGIGVDPCLLNWGVAKGSSFSWVAKSKGKHSGCKLSNAVAKLQGDESASFCRKMSGREVTGWQISIPVFHGTVRPMDFWTPPRSLKWVNSIAILHQTAQRMKLMKVGGDTFTRATQHRSEGRLKMLSLEGGGYNFECWESSADMERYSQLCCCQRNHPNPSAPKTQSQSLAISDRREQIARVCDCLIDHSLAFKRPNLCCHTPFCHNSLLGHRIYPQ